MGNFDAQFFLPAILPNCPLSKSPPLVEGGAVVLACSHKEMEMGNSDSTFKLTETEACRVRVFSSPQYQKVRGGGVSINTHCMISIAIPQSSNFTSNSTPKTCSIFLKFSRDKVPFRVSFSTSYQ